MKRVCIDLCARQICMIGLEFYNFLNSINKTCFYTSKLLKIELGYVGDHRIH